MTSRKILNESGFTLIEIIVTVVVVAILFAMIITFLSDSLIKSSDASKWLKASSNLNKIMANITADYNHFPRWQSLKNYNAGDKVLPISMNGRYYTCVFAGTSGASEPNWSDAGNVTDGTAKWDVKPWMWISTSAGMWKSATNYSIGDIVIPTNPNGHFYRCKTAGTSGATEPNWPKTGGSTISDGGVVWTRLIQYLKEAVGMPDSNPKSNSYGQCPGSNCISYYVTANKFIKFTANAEQDINIGVDPENILKITLKNDDGKTLTALFMVKEN
jgi:prepilin-type N-terminal cleavage/methylation domain-containing protein